MVLRLRQHNIGYTADGFYRSDAKKAFYPYAVGYPSNSLAKFLYIRLLLFV